MKSNLVFMAAVICSGSIFAGTMGPVTDIKNFYLRADIGYNFYNNPSAITASYLSNNSINALDSDVKNSVGYNVGLAIVSFLNSERILLLLTALLSRFRLPMTRLKLVLRNLEIIR
jgi:hypothetical protein